MILLLDGSFLLYRASFTKEVQHLTYKGRPTGGIYILLKSLRSFINRWKPTYVVMVGDYGYSERRKTILPEYKANRGLARTPEDQALRDSVLWQRKVIRAMMYSFGVRSAWMEGREADDLICQLSMMRPGQLKVVVSEDRDMLQLVAPDTHVYRPRADEYITPENFAEITGAADIEKFLLRKFMCGDGSDNVPGIPGVGEGTANIVIRHASTIDEAMAFSRGHKSARVRKVAANEDVLLINREVLDLRKEEFHSTELGRLREQSFGGRAMVSLAVVSSMCEKYGFESITKDLASWIVPFQKLQ